MAYINKSITDSHGTPDWIIEKVKSEYGEISDFDPCPLNDTPTFNGLDIDYPREKIVFINPPYSALKTTKARIGWVQKAHNECETEPRLLRLIELLVHHRLDINIARHTRWVHTTVLKMPSWSLRVMPRRDTSRVDLI